MYSIFKRLENDDFEFVASCDAFEGAAELVDSLNGYWPGEYVVRDAAGNEVDAVSRSSIAFSTPSASKGNSTPRSD